MTRYRMTTLEVIKRLDNHARWTMEERRAAIKALQGSVNRAYDRLTKDYGINNYATKAIEKKGKIRTWTELQSLSYKEQMAEIRKGAELAGMKTISKSGYDKYLSDVTDRLNQPSGLPTPSGGRLGHLYKDLTPVEHAAFWRMYEDVTASTDFLNSAYKNMDSERIQRWVFENFDHGVTVDQLKDTLNQLNSNTPPPVPPAGITFDPMDLI